ncbi:MAG: sigma-70 family RNA polymerase sigma factor [Fuerstiella sp.]
MEIMCLADRVKPLSAKSSRTHAAAIPVGAASKNAISDASIDAILGPSSWQETYGDYLFHFAKSRLSDSFVAEEVVQDTLLGALQSFSKFKGQASELTWLVGILRNKIADHYRGKSRARVDAFTDSILAYTSDWADVETAKVSDSVWSVAPADELERQEFWEVIHESMNRMPAGVATAFRLSVIEGQSTAAICDELNISSGNFWVRLHRARNYLAQIVNDRWNHCCCRSQPSSIPICSD